MSLLVDDPGVRQNEPIRLARPSGPGLTSATARRIAKLRRAIVNASTTTDVLKIWQVLTDQALAGDVQAIKLYFERLLGKVPDEVTKEERGHIVQLFLTQVNHNQPLPPRKQISAEVIDALTVSGAGAGGEDSQAEVTAPSGKDTSTNSDGRASAPDTTQAPEPPKQDLDK